ncbi:MAG: DUF4276 family protein [Candidatus Pacebacteria bacterium]|nr:DUF4276 family protein [Candidatus Paceibacterota bacterium]
MRVIIFIEGGNRAESRNFSDAFKLLFKKINPSLQNIDIRIQRDRGRVVRDFTKEYNKQGHRDDCRILMLIDGEKPRSPNSTAHSHIKETDKNLKMDHIPEDAVYIMQICMESWLISDSNQFPEVDFAGHSDLLGKAKVDELINQASKLKYNLEYHKIDHGIKFIANLDPQVAKQKSHSFNEFYHGLARLF